MTNTPNQRNYSMDTDEDYQQIYDVTIISDPNEPTSIDQISKSPEKDLWKEAAIAELKIFYFKNS